MRVETKPRINETRIRIPDVGFHVYETLIRAIPPRTAIRMAFDGRDLEIMVKGPLHHDYGWLLDRFITAVATELKIPQRGLGETTWIRPEIERGLEADECYVFEPAKLAIVKQRLASKDDNVAGYPNPDLAVEVDLSRPQADRPSIYAALRVPELWVFDGDEVSIQHLTVEQSSTGERAWYVDAGRSRWLPVSAEEVRRWLVDADIHDAPAWEERVREWARTELVSRLNSD
jgi:Uma2 family endonuclease